MRIGDKFAWVVEERPDPENGTAPLLAEEEWEDTEVHVLAPVLEAGPVSHECTYSWGADRLNQADLPLDYTWTQKETRGEAMVWVVDSGIRETHQEFAKGQVLKLFNAHPDQPFTD